MIAIKKNNLTLKFNSFTFPGGEVGIKLNAGDYKFREEKADHTTIIAHVQNSEDILQVAMVKDALQRIDNTPINLFIPYLPYARQDRVCDKGESFSLKVFCDLINNLEFEKVTICDPHSEVAPALLDNVRVISQFDIINKNLEFTKVGINCILISPDSGSNKKTSEIAKYFTHDSFVRADKLRDLTNGNIKETIVYWNDFSKRDVVCVDDICDGGKTFIELAKVCKAKNCGKFILYVTHGIFSKGVKVLYQNGIDEIWTTNSFRWINDQENVKYDEKVNVLKLEEKFEI